MPAKNTPDKFWAKIAISEDENACWLWLGYTVDGYGDASWHRKKLKAHRLAYELSVGEIPDGQCVLHRCDVRRCCNPRHLFLGTRLDNNQDRHAKGRDAHMIGDLHPQLKITEAQVDELRQRFAAGETNRAALGREYGITRAHAANIIKGRLRTKRS